MGIRRRNRASCVGLEMFCDIDLESMKHSDRNAYEVYAAIRSALELEKHILGTGRAAVVGSVTCRSW